MRAKDGRGMNGHFSFGDTCNFFHFYKLKKTFAITSTDETVALDRNRMTE